MIPVNLYFRNQGTRKVKMAAVPGPGAYIQDGDSIYHVDSIRYSTETAAAWATPGVDVFLIAVGATVARNLQADWEAWGEPEEAHNTK